MNALLPKAPMTASLASSTAAPSSFPVPSGVEAFAVNSSALPFALRPSAADTPLVSWAGAHREWIRAALTAQGAILFRGFGLADLAADFARFSQLLTGELLSYVYRSTPRTAVGQGVYSATEYPAKATIPQHNENAYCRDWPMKLMFLCTQASPIGGETPLSRTAAVTARIPEAVRSRFREHGVLYVRNYREGVDLPWQVVFQTERRDEVERFCVEHDLAFEWRADGSLRTRQVCQAFATHPLTGEELWFNQAHLFHVSSLDAQSRAAMTSLFDEDSYPRNTYYGDGSPIEPETLDAIRTAFAAETLTFSWRSGDVLLVDNMLVGHGRRPYGGPRKILVSMGEPFSTMPGEGKVSPSFGAAR
jgi:alpha-ketoglutarate-dependent taurine dioxygenase